MTIREAIESDIEAIAELEAAYAEEMRDLAPDQFRELEDPLSLEQLKRQLEDDKVKMFVAEEDTELAGYLSATIGSTVAPTVIETPSTTFSPKMWNSGRTP